jgi:hypothetical protein
MPNKSNRTFNIRGNKFNITLEKLFNLKFLDSSLKAVLSKDIQSLLSNCWGPFPDNFVEKHILEADKMIIARVQNRCIGLCVMSVRSVLGIRIHYIEFLLVNKEFQKSGLGLFLSFMMIKQEIFKNFSSILIGKPLEIFFITPNIRVLSSTARFASFIYPNPYLADKNGIIGPADEETWSIAQELLRVSDNPNRELERIGLVLKKSYANMPWLIYNNDTAPWHRNESINVFARNYLGYHNNEDREFMVRVHINFFSIVRYLLHK